MKIKKRKQMSSQTYKTYPLADAIEENPINNATTPSLDDIAESKDWVDFNEK